MHLVVNTVGVLVLAAAVAWLLSPAARDVRHGWKSKVVWVFAVAAGATFAGFYLPVGPLFVLREARRAAKGREGKGDSSRSTVHLG